MDERCVRVRYVPGIQIPSFLHFMVEFFGYRLLRLGPFRTLTINGENAGFYWAIYDGRTLQRDRVGNGVALRVAGPSADAEYDNWS
jgi:hypothetical protein